MNNLLLKLSPLLLLVVFNFSLTSCKKEKKDSTLEIVKGSYVCPMNCPKSKKDQPGDCHVCKMQLVKEVEVEEMKTKKEHSTTSVYKLDAEWIDQNNKKHQLSDYKGKLQLTTMIFTNCDYACPNLIGDLQNIEDALSPEAKSNLNYLLVTIDPENDTPEKLNKYANQFELDSEKWTFLTGSTDNTYQYSKLLGIGYKKFENGMYGHSNILSLLNKDGEIVYQIEGIHADRTEIVKIIENLSK
ncbi:MAG: SCO family protein [Flavobacteriales bacterium]|nr:SCO family protein [Flavobacteriales bacterium]